MAEKAKETKKENVVSEEKPQKVDKGKFYNKLIKTMKAKQKPSVVAQILKRKRK